MTRRSAVVLLWLGSVAAVGSYAFAEARIIPQPGQLQKLLAPEVITGTDFGFRVDRWENGEPVGAVVVKVDGGWVEARSGIAIRRVN